jgi:hypothetical protein
LFHYIGNPESKESGRLYGGIAQRLKDAGFGKVKKASRAFGLVAEAVASGTMSRGRGGYDDMSYEDSIEAMYEYDGNE